MSNQEDTVQTDLTFFSPSVGGIDKLNPRQTKDQQYVLNSNSDKYLKNYNKKFKTVDIYGDLHEKYVTPRLSQNANTGMDNNHNSAQVKSSDKFDPYIDWLFHRGLSDRDNLIRYNIHYQHIDSSYRQKDPTLQISEYFDLNENPIVFTENTTTLYIKHPNHPFQKDDKFTLDGFTTRNYKLMFNPTIPEIDRIMEFHTISTSTGSYNYITLKVVHGIPVDFVGTSYLNDLRVTIENFTNPANGDPLIDPRYYTTIPLTVINKRSVFFLTKTIGSTIIPYDPNILYIELPVTYVPPNGTYHVSNKIRFFNVILNFTCGVPVNLINAQYPVDLYHANNYHNITSINSGGYYIDIGRIAYSSGEFGGSNIKIGRVSDFTGGYVEPNNYQIQLEKVYRNIVMVKLISTEFPNINYIIRDSTSENPNNKFYWSNESDGSYVYSVEIPSGIYDANSLSTKLETLIYNTPRYYYPPKDITKQYTNHNYIKVNIDTATNTTTLRSFEEIIMARSITSGYFWDHINSTIGTLITTVQSADPTDPMDLYPIHLLIHHPSHKLMLNDTLSNPPGTIQGDIILINGAIDFMSIPSQYINGEFEIYAPPTSLGYSAVDYYMIKIPIIDMKQYTTRVDSGGGIFKIYSPTNCRYLFDQSDTIGSLLGFPNVGDSTSFTPYDHIITNKMNYVYSPNTSLGNAISLTGDKYLLMVCEELSVVNALGTIKNAFAKILLPNTTDKILYNTFVNTPKIYYDPMTEIATLTFSFYSPNGDLYDFNGLDHSFTLEITTLDETPTGTNISARTGKVT